jgi:hypothetical protein
MRQRLTAWGAFANEAIRFPTADCRGYMPNCFAHVRTPENLMGVPLRALARISGVLCGRALVERLRVSLDKKAFLVVEILRPFLGCTRGNGGVFRGHEDERA